MVTVPDVLEPELCRRLIDLYEADGGEEFGLHARRRRQDEAAARSAHKVRRDYLIEDPELARQLNLRLIHRLLPMVRRAFQFQATRVERLIVGCYEAETRRPFPRRTATTRPRAPRTAASRSRSTSTPRTMRAATCAFPNMAPRTYRAPTGGAIVFSCSLLHQAMPVTKGRRFAFLPFLYDDAGREAARGECPIPRRRPRQLPGRPRIVVADLVSAPPARRTRSIS